MLKQIKLDRKSSSLVFLSDGIEKARFSGYRNYDLIVHILNHHFDVYPKIGTCGGVDPSDVVITVCQNIVGKFGYYYVNLYLSLDENAMKKLRTCKTTREFNKLLNKYIRRIGNTLEQYKMYALETKPTYTDEFIYPTSNLKLFLASLRNFLHI